MKRQHFRLWLFIGLNALLAWGDFCADVTAPAHFGVRIFRDFHYAGSTKASLSPSNALYKTDLSDVEIPEEISGVQVVTGWESNCDWGWRHVQYLLPSAGFLNAARYDSLFTRVIDKDILPLSEWPGKDWIWFLDDTTWVENKIPKTTDIFVDTLPVRWYIFAVRRDTNLTSHRIGMGSVVYSNLDSTGLFESVISTFGSEETGHHYDYEVLMLEMHYGVVSEGFSSAIHLSSSVMSSSSLSSSSIAPSTSSSSEGSTGVGDSFVLLRQDQRLKVYNSLGQNIFTGIDNPSQRRWQPQKRGVYLLTWEYGLHQTLQSP